MIGDHSVRGLLRAVRGHVGQVGDGADQIGEQIDGVIVVRALQHRGDALEPHAGIDRGPRQVDALAAGKLLVLHEHKIPDLDEAVAVGFRRAGRTAGDVIAVVVEDFRAGAAGAGVAHGPEIVGTGDAQNFLLGQPAYFFPKIEGIVVVDIDRRQQLVFGQSIFLRDQRPSELDRAFLEVVAEGEISQHLEKSMVARGVADIVEVVVFAAGAHAFLRRRRARIRALFDAGEDVLELHHAGIGEHQRRVVARHERGRRHDLVVVAGEEIEETFADVVDAAHSDTLTTPPIGGPQGPVPFDILLLSYVATGFRGV